MTGSPQRDAERLEEEAEMLDEMRAEASRLETENERLRVAASAVLAHWNGDPSCVDTLPETMVKLSAALKET